MRNLSYAQAINEALGQLIRTDPNVLLIGQGVTSPWYVGTTTTGLIEEFGEKRVIDTPVSENGVTGIAVGASLAGMRPIVVHPRMDFMYYAMDQIANQAANWYYMFGGKVNVPLTIWGIINRGGEQASQHSQALQSLFMHIPGVKVVMPSTPFDAKGLLISAVYDDNPVIYIDDRWLYSLVSDVPEEIYRVPIGKAIIRKEGSDVTVVATSFMVSEVLKSAQELEKEISIEVVDLLSIKPLDKELLFSSVKKTGKLIVVDGGWGTCGISAEISSLVADQCFECLKAPIKRIALPDSPAPMSLTLEEIYYPRAHNITKAVKSLI